MRPWRSLLRPLRLKAFDRKDRKGIAKFAKRGQPRGCRWKRLCLPASQEAIGKETAAGMSPPVCVLSLVVGQWSLVAGQNSYDRAGPRPTTNDQRRTTDDERPTTNDQQRAANRQIRPRHHRSADLDHRPLQLQVCLLPHRERGRALRRSAVRRLSAHGAGSASDSESRRSASPAESRCCARAWSTLSASSPSCAPRWQTNSTSPLTTNGHLLADMAQAAQGRRPCAASPSAWTRSIPTASPASRACPTDTTTCWPAFAHPAARVCGR